MREDEQDGSFASTGRRKRLLWIVLAHLLIAVAFFAATFYMGNFE
jgi:uncharacterized membrane protein